MDSHLSSTLLRQHRAYLLERLRSWLEFVQNVEIRVDALCFVRLNENEGVWIRSALLTQREPRDPFQRVLLDTRLRGFRGFIRSVVSRSGARSFWTAAVSVHELERRKDTRVIPVLSSAFNFRLRFSVPVHPPL